MRHQIKNIYLGFLVGTVFLFINSCSNADESIENISGNGNISLKFENGFSGLGPIVLNSTTQTSTNGQKYQFSTLKYMVSNIVLIKEDGTEVKYNYNNPDLGAFIIDQADAVGGEIKINLTNIPAANYTKLRFGLGISQDAYLLGETGQANFWTAAKNEGMTWVWASGYIFIKLEGLYGTTTPETKFINHAGNVGNLSVNGNPNLYREITLPLPTSAKVRTTITPSIHVIADFNKYLSGKTPITLSSSNNELHGSPPGLVTVTDNLTQAFSVDHVHND